MALKQPTETTTNEAAQKAQLNLPPPHTFDVLPLLHEHLAQVDAYFNQDLSLDERAQDDGTEDIGASYYEKGKETPIQPLNPKELPTKVLDVKARIRSALRELEKLPDIDRSVEEQEEEIEELTNRIQRQREMLSGLADIARDMEDRLPR